jgi:hypothetical protein
MRRATNEETQLARLPMIGPMEIGIGYLVLMLVWLGFAAFVLGLATRFVKSIERIANAMERRESEVH